MLLMSLKITLVSISRCSQVLTPKIISSISEWKKQLICCGQPKRAFEPLGKKLATKTPPISVEDLK